MSSAGRNPHGSNPLDEKIRDQAGRKAERMMIDIERSLAKVARNIDNGDSTRSDAAVQLIRRYPITSISVALVTGAVFAGVFATLAGRPDRNRRHD